MPRYRNESSRYFESTRRLPPWDVQKDEVMRPRHVQEEFDRDWERYYYPGAEARRRKALYSTRPRDWTNENIKEMAADYVNTMMDRIPEYDPNDERMFVDTSYEEPRAYDNYVNALSGMRHEDMMAPHSIEPVEPQSKLSAFLFGYNPNGGGEDFGLEDAAKMGVYGIPVVGNAYYASELLDEVRSGGVPGFLETALAVPILGGALRRAPRFFKGLKNFRAQQEARQAFERELDKRALTMPGPNKKVLEQGDFPWSRPKMVDRYVDPNMEFTPYEEIGF